jgi:hypothetical protein
VSAGRTVSAPGKSLSGAGIVAGGAGS